MKQVTELPKIDQIVNDQYFEILTSDVSYFTHSFFKYPAKFIPQIPRWAIENYTSEGDIVLDCFSGSGTTLVEASLLNRIPLGIDFDKISFLLAKVKTTLYSNLEKAAILNNVSDITKIFENSEFPNIKNIKHWFPLENIVKLNSIYINISKSHLNENCKNFLYMCFISIIRKSSYSDEVSPKPYISSKITKIPQDAFVLFENVVNANIKKLDYEKYPLNREMQYIGNDARFAVQENLFNKVNLVCTSPPYINAFDYVRILRLENIWLRNLDDSNILNHKKKQIGTEQILSNEYNKKLRKFGIKELDDKIDKISKLDKKRAYVVLKYFEDMKSNLESMYKYLVEGGKYVMVVGDCVIKGVEIPTYKYIIELSLKLGYFHITNFSYLIKNPYLRIPRKSRGGLIKYDRIIILGK